jgi:hypothetical protein
VIVRNTSVSFRHLFQVSFRVLNLLLSVLYHSLTKLTNVGGLESLKPMSGICLRRPYKYIWMLISLIIYVYGYLHHQLNHTCV